jgi:hypothetical protein
MKDDIIFAPIGVFSQAVSHLYDAVYLAVTNERLDYSLGVELKLPIVPHIASLLQARVRVPMVALIFWRRGEYPCRWSEHLFVNFILIESLAN